MHQSIAVLFASLLAVAPATRPAATRPSTVRPLTRSENRRLSEVTKRLDVMRRELATAKAAKIAPPGGLYASAKNAPKGKTFSSPMEKHRAVTALGIERETLEDERAALLQRRWDPDAHYGPPLAGPEIRWETGSVGHLGEPRFPERGRPGPEAYIQVKQIIGAKESIVCVYGVDAWLSGVSTGNWIDNAVVQLPGVFRVLGNKTYTTALGGSRTIWHIAPAQPATSSAPAK